METAPFNHAVELKKGKNQFSIPSALKDFLGVRESSFTRVCTAVLFPSNKTPEISFRLKSHSYKAFYFLPLSCLGRERLSKDEAFCKFFLFTI